MNGLSVELDRARVVELFVSKKGARLLYSNSRAISEGPRIRGLGSRVKRVILADER